MVRESYEIVMDPDKNPLMALPRPVAFQLMTTLAWMWCVVFSLWIGSLAGFGPSTAIHMILLVGVFLTADIFAKAKKQQQASYDMLFSDSKDGGARYDDVWGAP